MLDTVKNNLKAHVLVRHFTCLCFKNTKIFTPSFFFLHIHIFNSVKLFFLEKFHGDPVILWTKEFMRSSVIINFQVITVYYLQEIIIQGPQSSQIIYNFHMMGILNKRTCYKLDSLQCRRILDMQVYIFVLGHHLGFGNCGGLERGNISQGSRCQVEKMGQRGVEGRRRKNTPTPPPLCTSPLNCRL